MSGCRCRNQLASGNTCAVEIKVQLNREAFGGAEIDNALAADRPVACLCAQLGHVQLVVGKQTADAQIGQPRAIDIIFVNQVIGADNTGQLGRLETARKIRRNADISGQALIRQSRQRKQRICRTIIAHATRQGRSKQPFGPTGRTGRQRCQVNLDAPHSGTSPPDDRARIAAIGQQSPDQTDVNRLRTRPKICADEAADVQPCIRARKSRQGCLRPINASGDRSTQAGNGKERIQSGYVDLVQPRLERHRLAIATGQPDRTLRQFDGARQNVIAAAARNDADGTSGCEIDTVRPALGSDAPKLRGEICIGGDAEGHFASALRQYLRRPSSIAIVYLCPGGGNRHVVPYGVFHLNIRDNLRAVIQNDVGFDDAATNGEFLRADEFRI